ncbi:MAG: hypothetical protein HND57_12620 [Planctomycetes bacterium]|nr:hypothetical protein [Planctomycetota bacterium]
MIKQVWFIFGILFSLFLLCSTHSVQAQVGSSTIPTLEESHRLTYRFPVWRTSAFDRSVTVYGPDLRYRLDVEACETVIRNDRQSDVSINASAVFDCRIPVTGGEEFVDEQAIVETGLPTIGRDVTLEMVTTSFVIACDAGDGSYEYRLDDAGLTRRNEALGEVLTWGWDDRYDQASTLSDVAGLPGTITIRNGAVLARPVSAPVLKSVNAEWLSSILSALLPPLPEGAIQPGVSWTAGSLVPASMFAEVPIMRFRAQWLTYDAERNRARIAWRGETSGTALIPRSGIHHIGTDAVAAMEVNGFITLDLDTGVILSGRIHTESEIAHARSSSVKAHFRADITINRQIEEPEGQDTDSEPVIATADEGESSDAGETPFDRD